MTAASFPIQVRFYELDPYGHVNHATYLQYFEAARVAWLDEIDHSLDELERQGVQLFVTTVATRFVAPARLNDRLRIETSLVGSKRIQAQWAQHAWRDDAAGQPELITCQRINFATVNLQGRPIRVPESLAVAMAGFQARDEELAKELPDLAL